MLAATYELRNNFVNVQIQLCADRSTKKGVCTISTVSYEHGVKIYSCEAKYDLKMFKNVIFSSLKGVAILGKSNHPLFSFFCNRSSDLFENNEDIKRLLEDLNSLDITLLDKIRWIKKASIVASFLFLGDFLRHYSF